MKTSTLFALRRLEDLGPRGMLLGSLAMAAVFEGLACLFRFGIGFESTADTAFLAPLTFGIRIHHGYIGLALLAVGALSPNLRWLRNAAIILGVSLVLSDVVHHFAILWPITGHHHFDLVYPC